MNYFKNIFLKIWASVKLSVRNEHCVKTEEKKKRNLKPNQHLWKKKKCRGENKYSSSGFERYFIV